MINRRVSGDDEVTNIGDLVLNIAYIGALHTSSLLYCAIMLFANGVYAHVFFSPLKQKSLALKNIVIDGRWRWRWQI